MLDSVSDDKNSSQRSALSTNSLEHLSFTIKAFPSLVSNLLPYLAANPLFSIQYCLSLKRTEKCYGLPRDFRDNDHRTISTFLSIFSADASLIHAIDNMDSLNTSSVYLRTLTTPDYIAMLPTTTDDLLFGYLAPADLIAYSKTCKTVREAVASFYRRAFRIEHILRRYFASHEILQFRELQATTATIISGSSALQFFDRTEYADSDLDLYVEHRFRIPVVLWLKNIGYTFVPRSSLGPQNIEIVLDENFGTTSPVTSEYTDAMFVLDFMRPNHHHKIQLITSSASPLELVLHFHSSCVMNFITHNKAYSVFPRATFQDRQSLIFARNQKLDLNAREKYENRGWRFIKDIAAEERQKPFSPFVQGSRYPGDAKCWTIDLHPNLNNSPNFLETNSWNLEYDSDKFPMHVWVLLKHDFHFTYLVDFDLYIGCHLNLEFQRNEDVKKNDEDLLACFTNIRKENRIQY